eukprot:g6514.t1
MDSFSDIKFFNKLFSRLHTSLYAFDIVQDIDVEEEEEESTNFRSLFSLESIPSFYAIRGESYQNRDITLSTRSIQSVFYRSATTLLEKLEAPFVLKDPFTNAAKLSESTKLQKNGNDSPAKPRLLPIPKSDEMNSLVESAASVVFLTALPARIFSCVFEHEFMNSEPENSNVLDSQIWNDSSVLSCLPFGSFRAKSDSLECIENDMTYSFTIVPSILDSAPKLSRREEVDTFSDTIDLVLRNRKLREEKKDMKEKDMKEKAHKFRLPPIEDDNSKEKKYKNEFAPIRVFVSDSFSQELELVVLASQRYNIECIARTLPKYVDIVFDAKSFIVHQRMSEFNGDKIQLKNFVMTLTKESRLFSNIIIILCVDGDFIEDTQIIVSALVHFPSTIQICYSFSPLQSVGLMRSAIDARARESEDWKYFQRSWMFKDELPQEYFLSQYLDLNIFEASSIVSRIGTGEFLRSLKEEEDKEEEETNAETKEEKFGQVHLVQSQHRQSFIEQQYNRGQYYPGPRYEIFSEPYRQEECRPHPY